MRKFKKFAAMASAAVLAACAAAPVLSFADEIPVQPATDPNTGLAIEYAVTVNSAKESVHTEMAAYQILTGSVDANDVLEVTGWGDGVKVSDFIDALKADATVGENFEDLAYDSSSPQTSAVEFAKIIAKYDDKSAKANAVAKVAARNLGTSSGTFDKEDTTIKYVESGYYIVVDVKAATLGDYSASTLGLLKVAGKDVTIDAKVDFPSFDKQIGDINDTDGGDTIFNESADWDMGDAVPFKLIATIPSNIDQYDTYKMIFHDDIQGGVFNLVMDGEKLDYTVTYYASATATAGTDVTGSFTYASSTGEGFGTNGDDEDFTLTCTDIKAINGVAAGGYFVVDYSATLTTEAKMGADGNWNSAYLEYSNNPNFSGSGENDRHDTGDSTVDSVVAFTYQTVVNKVDQNNDPLKGAEFTLYKEVADGGAAGNTFTKADNTTSAGLDANKKYVKISSTKIDGIDTQFEFKGLDDGKYVLVETKTPNSYNSAANLEFTIKAEHVQTEGNEKLESLSVDGKDKADFSVGKVYVLNATKDELESTGADKGSLSATVVNKYGSALPSTGGIGTKLFYLGGGAMVAVAGVFLITKKRMGKAEK